MHTGRLQSLCAAQRPQLGSGTRGAVANDEEHLMRTRQPTTPLRPGRLRRHPWHHPAALLLACGLLALAAPPAGAQEPGVPPDGPPTDPPPPTETTVQVSIAGPDFVAEGGEATFTVTVDGTTTKAVTFNYAVSAGSVGDPAETEDFDPPAFPSGSDSVPAGTNQSKPITVRIREDTKPEARKTFTVTLSAVMGGGDGITLQKGTTAVTTTIRASDPIFTLGVPGPSVAEPSKFRAGPVPEGGTVAFPVTLNPPNYHQGSFGLDLQLRATGREGEAQLADAIIVGSSINSVWFTPPGSSNRRVENEDFRSADFLPEGRTTVSRRLFFHPSGPSDYFVEITSAQDNLPEGPESYTLTITRVVDPFGSTLNPDMEPSSATATIAASDPVVSLGAPGPVDDMGRPVDAQGRVTSVFTPGPIPEGRTARFPIAVTPANFEGSLSSVVTRSVSLEDGLGGQFLRGRPLVNLGKDLGVVTIPTPRGGSREVASMPGSTTITATSNFNLVFSPDIESYYLDVTTIDDELSEDSELFNVRFAVRYGGTIQVAGVRTATIVDNDPITLGFGSPVPANGTEGGSILFPLTFGGVTPTADVIVDYTISGEMGSGITAEDFNPASFTGRQTIELSAINAAAAPGADPVTLPVGIGEDTDAEAAETFTVTLTGGMTAKGTISDVPPDTRPTARSTIAASDRPTVTAAIAAAQPVGEADGGTATAASFPITVTGTTTAPLIVHYTVSASGVGAGHAVAGDLSTGGTAPTALMAFPAPSEMATIETFGINPSGTITVPIFDDGDAEGPETFTVTLNSLTGGGAVIGVISDSASSATGTIAASDRPTVTAGIADAQAVGEADGGGATAASFQITVVGTTTAPLTVQYTVRASGTGAGHAEPGDLSTGGITPTALASLPAPSETAMITMTGMNPTGTITVPIFDDGDAEGPETFTVTLDSLTGGGAVIGEISRSASSATGTIAASDPVTLAIANPMPATVTEGFAASVAFPLTFGGGTPTGPVTVNYTLSGAQVTTSDFPGGLGTAESPRTQIYTAAQIMDARRTASPVPQTLSVAIADDSDPEAPEMFTVTLRSTTGSAIPVAPVSDPETASATITDNEPTAVAIGQPTPATATEGASAESERSFVFPLRFLGVLPTGDVTVSYRISGAAGVDDLSLTDRGAALPSLTGLSQPFTAAAVAGNRDQTLTLFVRDDNESEAPKDVIVTLAPAITRGLASEQKTATGTILDDDGISIDIVPVATTVVEGMPFEFNIVASRAVPAAVSGTYRTTIGTAGSADFTEVSGAPFTIPMGATRAIRARGEPFSVQTTDDSTFDDDTETFSVALALTPPVPAETTANDAAVTVTIRENDLGLTLRRSGDGSVAEADPVTFTLTRRGATSPEVTVAYEVGGSIDGDDFGHPMDAIVDRDNPLRRRVTLGAGETSTTFDLTITDDNNPEEVETLQLGFVAAGVQVVPPSDPKDSALDLDEVVFDPAVGAPLQIAIDPSDRVELVLERLTEPGGTVFPEPPDGGAVPEDGRATYRVRLGGDARSQALAVTWRVCVTGDDCPELASPAEVADFSTPALPTNTVNIAASDASAEFAVVLSQDAEVEGDERFVVQASATTAASVMVAAAPLTTTIVDDDARVAISTDQTVVTEGGTATFTFTRSGAPARAVDVVYVVKGTAGTMDYNDPRMGRVQIAAAGKVARVSIAIEPDDDEDEGETLQVEITSVEFAPGPGAGAVEGMGATAQITIVEGVRLSVVPEPPSTLSLPEGGGFRFRIVASREATADEPIRGRYRTRAGTAGAGDFTPTPEGGTPFAIPVDAAQTGVFELQIADDTEVDADAETFTIELEATSPADAVVRATTVTIQENDLRLTLSGPPEGQTDIDEASGGMATFTVSRAGATRSAVTVEYEVSGVEAGDLDDSSGPPLRGTVTLGAGQANTSFDLTIRDDAEAEGNETLEVRLVPESVTGVAGEVEFVAAADRPPRLTILEDDVGILVSAPSGTAGEGDTAVFTVTRRGDLRPEVALTYSIGGDGIDAADYEDVTDTDPLGTITLGEEQASAEIRIRIVPDGVSEPDEMLQVTVAEARPPALSPGGSFSLVMARAQVQIPRLEITVALSGPAEVPEGETAVFAVTLGLEPRRSVTTSEVRIAYTLGAPEVDTARRGDDYTSSSEGQGILRIPAGSSEGMIEVPVLRDGLLEAVEDFRLTLNPENSEGGGGSIRFAEVRQLAVRILDNADQEARREQRTRAMLAATHRAAAQMATDVISNRFSHRNVRAQASAASADREVGAHGEAQPQAPTVFADCVQGKSGRGRCAQRAVGERSHTAREERAVSFRLHAGERWRKHKRSRAESCSGRERTAEALARCASARSHSAAERSHTVDVNAQQERTPGALRRAGTAPDARAPGSSLATNALSTALRLTGLPTGPTAATGAGTDAALQDPESAALLAGIDVPARPFETDPYTVGGSGAPSTDASATDLGDALDPRLPSFAELLRGGHQFELSGEQAGLGGFGEGLSLWGAGTFQSLAGEPELDGRRLDYDGESFGVFLGADKRLALSGDGSELLAGAALGWTRGDLDYRDEALEVFELEGRFESKLWSIHPYASLRFSPRAQLWLIAGYGWGDAKIEERETREGERTATRRVETDATLWMVSAGAEGSVPLGSEASLLTARLQGTRTGGELDSARFGDGARLRGTRARTWRVAGELEVSHRFAFAEGGQFRPFATVRVRGDAGDDRRDDWEFAVDLGGGAELLWPERGLSLGLEGTAQLNQLQEYQEHRVTVDLSYDLAGDGRGLTVAVGSTLEGSERLGDRIDGRSGLSAGSAFTTAPYAPGAAPLGALLPGSAGRDDTAGRELGALRHSLQGEVGYGLPVLPFWSPGLLTPYARFELAGRGASAYATGLRFEAATGTRLGLELGVDLDRRSAATPPPDYQFLLTGELDF